jgi:hypothetical protein
LNLTGALVGISLLLLLALGVAALFMAGRTSGESNRDDPPVPGKPGDGQDETRE